MRTNNILERIGRGEKAMGVHFSFPSEEVVEMCGRLGLDFVFFDGQHSAYTPELIGRMCYVAEGNGLTPMMRIPDHSPSVV